MISIVCWFKPILCVVLTLRFMKNRPIVVAVTLQSSYHKEEEENLLQTPFPMKNLTKTISHLGKDAPITCQPRLLELYQRSSRKSTQPGTCRLPCMGASDESVLYCFASSVHVHMLGYIRETKTPKEAWGGPQKDICGQHNRMKTSTLPRVEQHSTEGYVHRQLHLEGQGDVWLPWVDQFQHWWRRIGADWTSIMVRCHTVNCLCEGESSLFFNLHSMLVVEENHVRTRGNTSDG